MLSKIKLTPPLSRKTILRRKTYKNTLIATEMNKCMTSNNCIIIYLQVKASSDS